MALIASDWATLGSDPNQVAVNGRRVLIGWIGGGSPASQSLSRDLTLSADYELLQQFVPVSSQRKALPLLSSPGPHAAFRSHSVGSPPNCLDEALPLRTWRLRGLRVKICRPYQDKSDRVGDNAPFQSQEYQVLRQPATFEETALTPVKPTAAATPPVTPPMVIPIAVVHSQVCITRSKTLQESAALERQLTVLRRFLLFRRPSCTRPARCSSKSSPPSGPSPMVMCARYRSRSKGSMLSYVGRGI